MTHKHLLATIESALKDVLEYERKRTADQPILVEDVKKAFVRWYTDVRPNPQITAYAKQLATVLHDVVMNSTGLPKTGFVSEPTSAEVLPAFIAIREICKLTTLSRITIWRMVCAKTFPQPHRLSPGRTGYLRNEVLAWLQARACVA